MKVFDGGGKIVRSSEALAKSVPPTSRGRLEFAYSARSAYSLRNRNGGIEER
jgi:hypothetical protein